MWLLDLTFFFATPKPGSKVEKVENDTKSALARRCSARGALDWGWQGPMYFEELGELESINRSQEPQSLGILCLDESGRTSVCITHAEKRLQEHKLGSFPSLWCNKTMQYLQVNLMYHQANQDRNALIGGTLGGLLGGQRYLLV